MGVKKNFRKTINGEDYLENIVTGKKRIFSNNGLYLHADENKSSLISELMQQNKHPTLGTMFGIPTLKEFLTYLSELYEEELGITKTVFFQNTKKDPPILEPLYQVWQNTRDPNWLYNLKEYAFETLHCNL